MINFLLMELSCREQEVIEAIVTIGKQDICMKQMAGLLHIEYKTLMIHRKNAMLKNGYTSWEGFLCDYVREEKK